MTLKIAICYTEKIMQSFLFLNYICVFPYRDTKSQFNFRYSG